jgi:hypothetical protein
MAAKKALAHYPPDKGISSIGQTENRVPNGGFFDFGARSSRRLK